MRILDIERKFMNIHTNIKEIIKKHGRGINNLTIAVGVSFILSARSLYFSTGQFGIEMFKSLRKESKVVQTKKQY